MTSIVNFEERMKSSGTLVDEFFALYNRIYDAKLTGSLKENEYSKLLILENKFFANLVRRGLRTEEDVETYENDIPNGNYPIGNYDHKDIKFAKDTIRQTNAAALFDAETLGRRTQIDSYSKGLRKVS